MYCSRFTRWFPYVYQGCVKLLDIGRDVEGYRKENAPEYEVIPYVYIPRQSYQTDSGFGKPTYFSQFHSDVLAALRLGGLEILSSVIPPLIVC